MKRIQALKNLVTVLLVTIVAAITAILFTTGLTLELDATDSVNFSDALELEIPQTTSFTVLSCKPFVLGTTDEKMIFNSFQDKSNIDDCANGSTYAAVVRLSEGRYTLLTDTNSAVRLYPMVEGSSTEVAIYLTKGTAFFSTMVIVSLVTVFLSWFYIYYE